MNKKNIFFLLLITFVAQKTYADLITGNIENGCYENNINIDDNNDTNLYAIFSKNNYECSVGYFLPGDTEECRVCGTEHACPGGIYTFNENKSQGIEWTIPFKQSSVNSCISDFINIDSNSHVNLFAIFSPNQYTCSAGYYLPANVDSCIECPRNNYCTGGTYTFNETTNQGIEPCSSNTPHAPTGSAVCYPHILHIGENNVYLKSTKLTTPSLNIAIEGSIFYANLTTTPTYMNKASEQSLKIMVNGIEYYVCDDTSCPGTE